MSQLPPAYCPSARGQPAVARCWTKLSIAVLACRLQLLRIGHRDDVSGIGGIVRYYGQSCFRQRLLPHLMFHGAEKILLFRRPIRVLCRSAQVLRRRTAPHETMLYAVSFQSPTTSLRRPLHLCTAHCRPSNRHHALAAHSCFNRSFTSREGCVTLSAFTPVSQLSVYAHKEVHAWGAHGLLRVFSGRNNRMTQTRIE